MSISFLDHPGEREGLIEVRHSLTNASGDADLRNVKHVIIDPHGSWEVPPVTGLENHLGQYDSDSVQRHLAVERDLGIPELRDQLVDRVPDTLAINFKVNRALADPNREPAFALQSIMNPADPAVKAALQDWHARGLTAVDQILAKVAPGARVSLLHSTEFFDYPALTDEDLKSPEAFKAYMDRVVAAREKEYQNCIMTGDADGSTRADGQFTDLLTARLTADGIPFALNNPYVTKLGRHVTSRYMEARPGRVNAMDWRKDMLATGSGAENTFALDTSVPDAAKVDRVAELFAETLKEAMGGEI